MSTTLEHLEKKILSCPKFGYNVVDVESLGWFLCGMNFSLARKPFSQEFLENVAYNSDASFAAVMWLQLNTFQPAVVRESWVLVDDSATKPIIIARCFAQSQEKAEAIFIGDGWVHGTTMSEADFTAELQQNNLESQTFEG